MKIGLNVGGADRALRVIVGCVLIGPGFSSWLTGVIRFCPAYTLFGINTDSDEA